LKLVPERVYDRMVTIRRDIHQHPELSWGEHRTMAAISAELTALGIAHRTGVANTGVVADLPGPAGIPAVMLRADTDALPVFEETGLPFASTTPGVMHACGHDGHTSMLLGAARLLVEAGPLPAPVRLVWQPAEEKGAGAHAMIAEGVLDGVGCAFGGHVDRRYDAGTLVVTDGAVNASTDTFHIEIRGQDAHGARPHDSVDAIVVGSLMVMSIQTIVSREVDPSHPSVVTVGRFSAGAAPNVIAGRATLEGTIRAQDDHVRQHLRRSIRRIAESVAALHQAEVDVQIRPGTPALCNQPLITAVAREAALNVAGAPRVCPLRNANMGGEDFAFFLERIPGCYIRFGAKVPGRESFPAHSSRFDFDEKAMATGAAWFFEVARRAAQAMADGQTLREPDVRA